MSNNTWSSEEEQIIFGNYTGEGSGSRIKEALKDTRTLREIRKKIYGMRRRKANPLVAVGSVVADKPSKVEKEQATRIEQLEQQVRTLTHRERKTKLNFSGEAIRFGVISDTHLGSINDNNDLNEAAYDEFQKEGIKTVLHCGDITEGWYPRREGFFYELRPEAFGYDLQVAYVVENYPVRKEITTKLLMGNHDSCWIKHARADICQAIADKREDIEYVGEMEARIHMKTANGQVEVCIFHPADGSAYARSYKLQKMVQSLEGGKKPDVLIVGHYHKQLYMTDRNIHCIEAGTTESQSMWMRGKHIQAIIGFWIIELVVHEAGVAQVLPRWYPDYG